MCSFLSPPLLFCIFYCILAVGRAVLLAQEVSKFPQECMKADRDSAYRSAFDSVSTSETLRKEFEQGFKVYKNEAVPGEMMKILHGTKCFCSNSNSPFPNRKMSKKQIIVEVMFLNWGLLSAIVYTTQLAFPIFQYSPKSVTSGDRTLSSYLFN